MVSQFCVRPTSNRWFLTIIQLTMKHDSFDAMWEFHVDFYIPLAITYSVGPSSVVQSEFGPAPPSPPMKVLKVQWSRALGLVCEVILNEKNMKKVEHVETKL